MKNNVNRVNYKGELDEFGNYWTWRETCDDCGKLIFDENFLHGCQEDESKKDYCIECLRKK